MTSTTHHAGSVVPATAPHANDAVVWTAFEGPVLDATTLDPMALRGKTVALVGDPAQLTRRAPAIARRAERLKVFQVDGVWVLPTLTRLRLPGAPVERLVPTSVRRDLAERVATAHLRREVSDAWTRRQLTPRRPPTRASIVYSDRYYRTLRRRDVEFVNWPIAGVVGPGIRTADGIEHHVDVIVVA